MYCLDIMTSFGPMTMNVTGILQGGWKDWIILKQIEWSRAYCICSFCLSACLMSAVIFALTFEQQEIETSYLICKVNDLVTLFDLCSKIAFTTVAAWSIVFHKHVYIEAGGSCELLWSYVVRRPSLQLSVVVIFSHFRLLLNRRTEFNETWQEAISQRPLLSLCFWADRKTRWPPWPRLAEAFSTSPLNGFKEQRWLIVKLLACGARGRGFNSRSHPYDFRDWLSPVSKWQYNCITYGKIRIFNGWSC